MSEPRAAPPTAGEYSVRAHNYAFDSDNRIHADDVAGRFGFRGGLVPGVADFAYLMQAMEGALGPGWRSGGWIEARLLKPLYHGEPVLARARPAPEGAEEAGRLELLLTREGGEVCARGEGGARHGHAPPRAEDWPRAPLPEPRGRLEPSIEALSPGRVLGSLAYLYDPGQAYAEARERFVDPLPGGSGAGLAWHPALALHDANQMLRHNVALGPWIHTGSRLELFGTPAPGEEISVRGRVIETGERKGHIVTRVDLACVTAGTRVFARVRHDAIVRLRPPPGG